MTNVAASYGYEITAVPEGHRVTYQRLPIPRTAYIQGSLFVGFVLLLILFLTALIPVCGLILLLPALALIPLQLRYYHRKRARPPTTFLVTPTHLEVGDQRFDRQHIARFIIDDPLTNNDVVYTQQSSGGYYVGGTGAAGVGMAAGMQALDGIQKGVVQIGTGFRDAADKSLKSVNVNVKFAYGEHEHLLANGLNATRARLLTDAVVQLMNPSAPASTGA